MTFADIISKYYNDINTLFKSRMHKRDMEFNEDSFNDAFIKCFEHFKDSLISYDDAVKYFWTVYIHIVLNEKIHESYETELPEDYDCECPEYNKDIDNLYNTIIEDVRTTFGESGVDAINEHLHHKKQDSRTQSRKICRYIKSKYNELAIDTICR